MSVKATVRPGVFSLSDDVKIKIAEKWRDALQAQAKTGIVNGMVLRSTVTGKKLDLYETGNLWRESVQIGPLTLSFTAPYARFLEDKYHFTKMGHIAYLKFIKSIAPILKKALKAKGK